MDPISQAALGAVVAHGFFHKYLGARVAVWGAIAGAAPDLDVFLAIGGDDFDGLMTHRGITHSLFFAPVVGPVCGALIHAYEQRRSTHRGTQNDNVLQQAQATDPLLPQNQGALLFAWIGAITLALWSHPLLDYLTFYGTQLLEPFSNQRFALPTVPIVEPIYTGILLFGLTLVYFNRFKSWTGWVSVAALVISCAYLGWGRYLNNQAEVLALQQLRDAGIEDAVVRAYPSFLTMTQRRLIATRPHSDMVSYINLLEPCKLEWRERVHQQSDLFAKTLHTREGSIFQWFAIDGLVFSAEANGDGTRVRLIDARFGFDLDITRSLFLVVAEFDAEGALLKKPTLGRSLGSERALDILLTDVCLPPSATPPTATPLSETTS